MNDRERSLSNAKILGAILIVLGIANGVAGVIVGLRIEQPALNEYGERITEVSPTGVAFIANAVVIGVILVLAGSIVVAFANALRPPGAARAAPAPDVPGPPLRSSL